VKRSVKLVFSTNTLFLFFSVTTSLLSAWALGAEGRGDLTIVTMWLSIFVLVGAMGLPYAHRYWAAREAEWQSEIFSNTLIYTFIISIVTISLAWFVVPLILHGQKAEIIRLTQIFLFNIPVVLLSEMLRGQLEGAKLFGWLGAARIAFITTQGGGYLLFYVLGWLTLINALWIIVVGQILCVALMLFAVWFKLRPKWRLSRKVFRNEIGYGLRSYFGNVTELAVWRLDQMMLTALATSFTVGLYSVAVALSEITAMLASSVSDALMPEVASSSATSDSMVLMGKTIRLTFYAHLLALIPLWIFAPYLLGVVYGESFVEATGVLRVLLVCSIVWSMALIVISGLNGLGRPGLSTIARLFSAATTVITLLYLLPKFGMMGAAYSSLIGYSVLLVVSLICLKRSQNINLWEFLRPRRGDISIEKLKSFFKFPVPLPTNIKS
jgi:O-antigen/teichoic acid export membrane protein